MSPLLIEPFETTLAGAIDDDDLTPSFADTAPEGLWGQDATFLID